MSRSSLISGLQTELNKNPLSRDEAGTNIGGAIWDNIIETPSWIGVTYENSWVDYGGNYNGVEYWKDILTNIVYLRGMCKNGTVNTTLFTLPSGYRPSAYHLFPVATADYATHGPILTVRSTGAVIINGLVSNSFVSLSGVFFHV